jgi:hypothetical protein
MSLQRQRPCGGNDLDKKGQPRAEFLDGGLANYAHRVLSDNLVQWFALHSGGCERMRAKPQLSLRLTRRFPAEKLRYGRM